MQIKTIRCDSLPAGLAKTERLITGIFSRGLGNRDSPILVEMVICKIHSEGSNICYSPYRNLEKHFQWYLADQVKDTHCGILAIVNLESNSTTINEGMATVLDISQNIIEVFKIMRLVYINAKKILKHTAG